MSNYLDHLSNDQFNAWVQRTNVLYGLARIELGQSLPIWLIEEIAERRHYSGKSVAMLAMLMIGTLDENAELTQFTRPLRRKLFQWFDRHGEQVRNEDRLQYAEEAAEDTLTRKLAIVLRDADLKPGTPAELRRCCRRLFHPIP